jgi:hypothetical protein
MRKPHQAKMKGNEKEMQSNPKKKKTLVKLRLKDNLFIRKKKSHLKDNLISKAEKNKQGSQNKP